MKFAFFILCIQAIAESKLLRKNTENKDLLQKQSEHESLWNSLVDNNRLKIIKVRLPTMICFYIILTLNFMHPHNCLLLLHLVSRGQFLQACTRW